MNEQNDSTGLRFALSDGEYAEALTLARASLGNGGQRTLLAKALLRAVARVAELEAQADAHADERRALASLMMQYGARGDEDPFNGVKRIVAIKDNERSDAIAAEREACVVALQDAAIPYATGSEARLAIGAGIAAIRARGDQ